MFCSAVIGALQAGQAERGTIRLKGSRTPAGTVDRAGVQACQLAALLRATAARA